MKKNGFFCVHCVSMEKTLKHETTKLRVKCVIGPRYKVWYSNLNSFLTSLLQVRGQGLGTRKKNNFSLVPNLLDLNNYGRL